MRSETPSIVVSPPRIPGLELHEKIGQGGMSVVYRATHCTLQRSVAVKFLSNNREAISAGIRLRESRLMAALTHPHVVIIHDAGEVDECRYLVMEHMAGGSLRERITPGHPWKIADVVALLRPISEAVQHIHAQEILHLDLKPENILYSAGGQVKIADFGLSVPHSDARALNCGAVFQGTLDYCAPEHRAGLGLDQRYDVFSLATITYELLAGELPSRVYIPISNRNPNLPKALDWVLQRGLARDPNERFSSIAEFHQAFLNASQSNSGRSRGSGFNVLLILVAMGILACLTLWLMNRLLPTPTSPHSYAMVKETKPDRLIAIYDSPDDLALLLGEKNHVLGGIEVALHPVGSSQQRVPEYLPLSVRPVPRPLLVVRSSETWGFIYPLEDASLCRRIVEKWGEFQATTNNAKHNLIRAGGFAGDCLVKGHVGKWWRGGNTESWNSLRQIRIDRLKECPDNPVLCLSNLDPKQSKTLLGCYQHLERAIPPNAALVLRYRARSLYGRGSLAVYAGLTVTVSEEAANEGASRIRRFATPLPLEPEKSKTTRWLYRCPTWIVPTTQWQTYLIVLEVPSDPVDAVHSKVVVDLKATRESAIDQVWIDDIELLLGQKESGP